MKRNIAKSEIAQKEITQANIQQWLKRDMENIYSLLHEIVSSESILNVMAAKLFENYQAKKLEQSKEQLIDTLHAKQHNNDNA